MAATQQQQQLQRLLSDYLTDELRVHEFTPFLLDAIVQNDLLNDRYDATTDEFAALKRKWTVRLNALLQSKTASTRWAALRLVKVTCEQSLTLYTAHVQSWSAQCLGFLARPEPTMVHTAAIEVLTLLFAKAVGKPELQAEVASKSMPRYNQLLLSLSSATGADRSTGQSLMHVTLPALTANMRLFPSNTRHVMDKIFKACVIPSLEGTTLVDPAQVGEYLAASSKAGGKAAISTAWQENLQRLTGTVHAALDRLFDTIDEEDTIATRPESYESLSAFPAEHTEAFPVILKRVRYLMDVMATYVTLKTEGAVVVPFGPIIQLVCRIYNVYQGCAMREFKPKNEYTCLMALLPSLYISTNKLLASVLYCARGGLTQFGKLFSRILLRLLTESKGKRSLRISVYELMALSLQQYGHAFASVVCKPLVQSIIQDVAAQEKKNVVDIIAPTSTKGGKKRRLDQHASSLLDGSHDARMQPSDIQLAALDAAEQLLIQYGSTGMPDDLRVLLDTTVVTRLLTQDEETEVVVKGRLYSCLLASVLNPPSATQSSLLPFAIRIFSAGVNDSAQELRSICSRGMAVCDLCIHTRLPPIQRAAAPVTRAKDTLFHNEEEEEEQQQQQQQAEPSQQPAVEPSCSSHKPAAEEPTVARDAPIAQSSFSSFIGVSGPEEQVPAQKNPPVVVIDPPSSPSPVVVEKESSVLARTMSGFVPEEDRTVIEEDIEMVSRQSSSMLTDTSSTMSIDETTVATAATTTLKETEDGDEEVGDDFMMPDIDMAGPDDEDDE